MEAAMQRFVVLRHEPGPASDRELHWDLMLEDSSSLRTWALESPPGSDAAVAATELPRHRKEYLDYEGAVSRERGVVTRFDHGTYVVTDQSDNELRIEFRGELLQIAAMLKRNHNDQRWLVTFDSC